jgi:hypothetical protein
MLRKLRRWINGGREWRSALHRDPSYRLGPGPHEGQPVSGWLQTHIDTGAVAEWLRYGSPEYGTADAAFLIVQLTPTHYVRPMTVLSEISDQPRLENLPSLFRDTYFDLTTRLGVFRAQEFTLRVEGETKNGIDFLSRFGAAPLYCQGWMTADVGDQMKPEVAATAIDGLRQVRPLHLANADQWLRARLAGEATVSVRRLGYDAASNSML